jgi:hypothetical protein
MIANPQATTHQDNATPLMQRQHELMLSKENAEQMMRQYPVTSPEEQKAEKERKRKHARECMRNMHFPKCAVDGYYEESKHQEEMQIKRNAYLLKLNPPRQDYPASPVVIGNPLGGNPLLKSTYTPLPPYPYIQPDWELIEEMFPAYKRGKCYQDFMDEQQIQQMRNQFEFRDRGGDPYNKNNLRPIPYQVRMEELAYSNQSGGEMIAGYGGILPYWPQAQVRQEKCRGVDERIKDDMVPLATKSQCANLCTTQNRNRIWDNGYVNMTDKEYIAHLEKQRDTPGTSSPEFHRLDIQLWNEKQRMCEKEKLYKLRCSEFEKKQEKKEEEEVKSLLPLAIAGIVLYVILK